MISKWGTLTLFVGMAITSESHATSPSQPSAVNCSQATLGRPGIGVAYRGHVSNDDYRLSVQVPAGLTGWGGVAEEAPFHGFVIFLGAQQQGCISLEINIRVDELEVPSHPASARVVKIGNRHGLQWRTQSDIDGVAFTNINTSFSSRRGKEVDDGQVLLVAPTRDLSAMKHQYDAFIRTFKFGR